MAQFILYAYTGFWLVNKARNQAKRDPVKGVYWAARNLRKQGVPIDIAVMALAWRAR